jgi:hypothetical protein
MHRGWRRIPFWLLAFTVAAATLAGILPPAAISVAEAQAPASPLDAEQSYRLIVMPPEFEVDDPAAAVFMATLTQAIVDGLNTHANFETIALSAIDLEQLVPPGPNRVIGQRLVRNALTHQYGRHYRVETKITAPSRDWLVNLDIETSDYGSGTGAITSVNDPRTGGDAYSIGTRWAARIVESVPSIRAWNRISSTDLAILVDATRDEEERVEILDELHGAVFSPEIVSAAIQLGTHASSAEVRQTVWESLRNHLFDPALVPALANVLVRDPDDDVRLEAAAALAAYPGEDVGLQALRYAELSDSSPKVRLAARAATLSRQDNLALLQSTLLDSTLPVAERAAPLLLDNSLRAWAEDEDPGNVLFLAYAHILEGADDVEIKIAAINAISSELTDGRIRQGPPSQRRANPDPYVVGVLLDALQHDAQKVRAEASGALQMLRRDPRVCDALEETFNQPFEGCERMRASRGQ